MSRTETAILAGGCFWGMQDLIRKVPGVLSTRVGYSGGDVPNATYRNHGTHADAIDVEEVTLGWNSAKCIAASEVKSLSSRWEADS
jgi:peptide methionine sulfoxide reductase MsrA